MPKKREMILDFDGVIGDTFAINWSIVQALHPEVAESGYRIDHHLGNVFEKPIVRFTPETTTEYYRRYNELLQIEHIQAALPALRALASDFRFHIVSSNCEGAIERVLDESDLLQHFGSVLGYAAHASKVKKFERLATTHDFALQDALFVTDTLGDLNEAATVGLPAIAVTFGYHPREVLSRGRYWAIVDSWDELIEVSRKA